MIALGAERNDTVHEKTLGLNDFYLAGEGRDWPLGNIQMLGESNADAMRGEEPTLTALAPRWSLAEIARHGVDFWLNTEDLPKPGNRITLDRDRRRTRASSRASGRSTRRSRSWRTPCGSANICGNG